MNAPSHRLLGQQLLSLLPDLPPLHTRLFLLGCVQPDKNPTTYLKGSLRFQLLRGHNYPNAQRYIYRLYRRIAGRPYLSVLECYQLGKLIHYIADAFTYAHDPSFSGSLQEHRLYERKLEISLRRYLQHPIGCADRTCGSPAFLKVYRKAYIRHPNGTETDARFIWMACTSALENLMSCKLYSIPPAGLLLNPAVL